MLFAPASLNILDCTKNLKFPNKKLEFNVLIHFYT